MTIALVLGIDVGISGAVAYLSWPEGELLDIEDMPTDRVTVSNKTRNRVSDVRFLALLPQGGAHAFIERPEGRPMRGKDKRTGQTVLRTPGAAGMLAFGESFGIVRCACTAKGLAVTEMRPGAWKSAMVVSGDKDEARRRAAELAPRMAAKFARKGDDGRAEAYLLGPLRGPAIEGKTG